MSNPIFEWFRGLFPPAPPPELPAEVQQELGQAAWEAWHYRHQGKTFMFGDMHRAFDEIKAKYPLWEPPK